MGLWQTGWGTPVGGGSAPAYPASDYSAGGIGADWLSGLGSFQLPGWGNGPDPGSQVVQGDNAMPLSAWAAHSSRPYTPGDPGSGQYTGPGGDPFFQYHNWNPNDTTRAQQMSGLGAYARPGFTPKPTPQPAAAQGIGAFIRAGAAPRAAAPPPIREPHGSQIGAFAGGWGTGPLARTWEQSGNQGRTWTENNALAPGSGVGKPWTQTGDNSYTRKF